jgi:hypothetical protein
MALRPAVSCASCPVSSAVSAAKAECRRHPLDDVQDGARLAGPRGGNAYRGPGDDWDWREADSAVTDAIWRR